MEHPTIFSATLGLSHPWEVTSVRIDSAERRLDITIDYANDRALTCPRCGATRRWITAEQETWYHGDFFRYATYLHARVPRVECCCGETSLVQRPWCRSGSKFSLITSEELREAVSTGHSEN